MNYIYNFQDFNTNEGLKDNLKKVGVGAALLASLASCKKQDTPETSKNWGRDTTNVIIPKDTIITPKDTSISINGTWYPVCNQDPDDQHFIINGNNFDWVWSKRSGNGLVIKYSFIQNSDGSLKLTSLDPSYTFNITAVFNDGRLKVNGTECVKLKK